MAIPIYALVVSFRTTPSGGWHIRLLSDVVMRSVSAVVVAALIAAACTSPANDADTEVSDETSTSTTVAEIEASEASTVAAADVVDELLGSLSVEEKVGQLLMPLVFGQSATDLSDDDRENNLADFGFETPAEIIEAYHLGGVIYLAANIDSSEQVRTFSSDMQRVAAESSGIGMLIAVDQEGGRVARLEDEVTAFPAADVVGPDPERVHESSYVTGQQVQQQGINVVLAPVADVRQDGDAFIGDRSFGEDPDQVASMVVAAIDGLQQAGVAATVKHWPGHGRTSVDSHRTLPSIDTARAEWRENEAVPFEAAIDADVALVMVGHLAFPGLDTSARPATVSSELIDGLLRDEFGYDGVVITDALDMGALDDIPQAELAVQSLQAGADIMLQSLEPQQAYQGLVGAVEDGEISQEVLDEAVGRVLRLKYDLGLLQPSS